MIGWGDVYKVVEAMLPLYTALALGFASVRWWRMFTPEQSDAINKFVSCFAIPIFNLEFTLHIDPFAMNYRFIAADVVAKAATVLVLVAWAACGGAKQDLSWPVTSFSLSALNNLLVVGVPLVRAMYGPPGQDLVVQSFVMQALVWLPLLLFALEYRKAVANYTAASGDESGAVCIELPGEKAADGGGDGRAAEAGRVHLRRRPSSWAPMTVVLLKLSRNPNTYGSVLGMTWAAVANRWHLKLPAIVEGSVLIMSRAGAGMAMFSMGLFMANQEKLIACGPGLTAYAVVLRFVAGPMAMAIGSIPVGLRGAVLRIAILQAALPQAITSFVFAKEYGLHANVLSTAVIFGTLASLPLLIAYYAILELRH
ncbi:hypothetical protein Taro_050024 [Colocasia esculenta]|uniref:Auxin efflux carrier component n=1 Tax=Colocasia esculenta TaxID=4460 RepID=A0A843XCM6_COLES|nr:hypothetical protein [Colocasia esculenta]